MNETDTPADDPAIADDEQRSEPVNWRALAIFAAIGIALALALLALGPQHSTSHHKQPLGKPRSGRPAASASVRPGPSVGHLRLAVERPGLRLPS
jgi:hypothetical protein